MEQAKDQGPQNPADRPLPLVTFDANIIYGLRNNEPDVPPVRQLLALNRAGIITINVTLSTALEEQRPDEQLGSKNRASLQATPSLVHTQ